MQANENQDGKSFSVKMAVKDKFILHLFKIEKGCSKFKTQPNTYLSEIQKLRKWLSILFN